MDGGIEAVGDIATGALAGRAVEPSVGEGAPDDGAGLCLNCGTALKGPHCHVCGQSAHVHRSIGAISHEILHGVLHFEGKLWRTLPLLAWRPGALTRRYIAGERARFVSPMALFLFSIFSMFAVFSIMGISPPAEVSTSTQVEAGLEQAIEKTKENREELVEKRAGLAANDPERAKLGAQIAELDRDMESIRNMPSIGPVVSNTHTGWARLDHGAEKWRKNPGLMLYKLQSSGYKFSWLLIPISLPFMWLLFFWKRGVRMYDHAVFVTYSVAFMSLLFIALTVAGALGVSMKILAAVGILVPLWHIHRQLKGAYRLTWFSALAREAVLLVFMVWIVTLFLLALLLLGMVG